VGAVGKRVCGTTLCKNEMPQQGKKIKAGFCLEILTFGDVGQHISDFEMVEFC